MKKFIAIAFVLVAVICAAVYLGFGTAETATAENDYLRIHAARTPTSRLTRILNIR